MSRGKKLLDKFLYALGFEGKDDEQLQHEWDEVAERKRAKLVGLPANPQLKVMVLEPGIYDEVQQVAEHLKGKKQVIINLEQADRETGQRIVDFLSGVTYALNGSMQKIGNNIFLFTPSNVVIASESKSSAQKVVNFNWERNSKGE